MKLPLARVFFTSSTPCRFRLRTLCGFLRHKENWVCLPCFTKEGKRVVLRIHYIRDAYNPPVQHFNKQREVLHMVHDLEHGGVPIPVDSNISRVNRLPGEQVNHRVMAGRPESWDWLVSVF